MFSSPKDAAADAAVLLQFLEPGMAPHPLRVLLAKNQIIPVGASSTEMSDWGSAAARRFATGDEA
jgi:hypothetical protein